MPHITGSDLKNHTQCSPLWKGFIFSCTLMAITFLKGGAFGNRLGQQEKVVSGLYPQGKKS